MKVKNACIYMITYPNGKIYIGQDRTDDINYFGSAKSLLIEMDFSREERQSFTITKDILWEAENIEVCEINKKEIELIRLHESNNPDIGYNRFPRKSMPRKTQIFIYESSKCNRI